MREYLYNLLKEDTFYVKEAFKEKGKEYGIAKLEINYIHILTETIDLMSVAPSISVKFSTRIEEYLSPRFQEISSIIYEIKTLPNIMGVELSKENHKDILKGLDFSNVASVIKKKNYAIQDMISKFSKVKFSKFK